MYTHNLPHWRFSLSVYSGLTLGLKILIFLCLYYVYRSERKAFNLRERQRFQNLKEGVTQDGPSASSSTQSGSSVTAAAVPPLRLPRETSQALRLLDPSMGLGRGITSHRTGEATPGQSSLVEHSGLGLGRGASIKVELPIPSGIGRGKPL
jgi:hypothetical protein